MRYPVSARLSASSVRGAPRTEDVETQCLIRLHALLPRYKEIHRVPSENPSRANRPIVFAPRTSVADVEEGLCLSPKFDHEGLMPCITTDAQSGEVLMLGYMNQEALTRTIETGLAHYWSRSRQVLWSKGATSGLTQRVIEMRVDDDQDALWLRVEVAGSGASCHVGYRSCFYRSVELPSATLRFTEAEKAFDPVAVYGDAPNPTRL
jgi:phosphoribosyl-AMP cyclohydrolase